jgi:hypothetical protein
MLKQYSNGTAGLPADLGEASQGERLVTTGISG